jgi:transcriptional regulator with XRE-family HTH domain
VFTRDASFAEDRRMPESFGARLRQRREEQAITLATIAEQTKIKLPLLDALERDDLSHWPSGIFRRAYLRAYAHAIGLNPDVVVREFLEVHPEKAEVVQTLAAIASAADGTRLNARPPTRLRHILRSATESLSRLRRTLAVEDPVLAHGPSVSEPASSDPDFLVLAQLCTDLGRVGNTDDVQRLLPEAARLLDAIGLIVWAWDGPAAELRPVLVHGYSDKVLAQLPAVRRDSDNATAAAFRSGRTCAVNGTAHTSGALVVPLLTSAGCAGVLAIELQRGSEQARTARAVATILAAMLAQLMGGAAAAHARVTAV